MMGDTSRDRTSEQESPIAEQEGSKRFEAGENLNKALKEEYDRRESEKSETGFRDAGEDPTLPGQEEIKGGTPEHERVLKAYPTATSYAPDVNVVLPDPPQPPPGEGEDEQSDEEDEGEAQEPEDDDPDVA
jgi:hypothetical protein